ncbi:T9SS type A sorting domain-containing protein [uncultured Polaribacter sp.]|uniref:T9SS type A sorting domain-containing protein n=1 Tax=uncultured Polaribacter sp. TaxID=174711 RepID=UPI00260A29D6|nr:T9SS type A sorting domain-containing protein [uncultured Polaribacter sp.]
MKKILHKLLFAALLISGFSFYSQTALPGTVEVETGTFGGVVGTSGSGINNLRGGSANFVTNNVIVAVAGNYDFTFTYNRSGAGAASVTMEIVDPATGLFSAFAMPQTSGAGTITKTAVTLPIGTYDIKFYNANGNGFSLDKYEVTASTAPIPPTMTSTKVGNWNDPTVWTVSGTAATTPSTTPTAEYDVVLGHVVTIPSNMGAATAKSIGSTSGAQLILRQNNTLTVEGDISLARSNDGMILYAQNGNFSTVTIGGTYATGKKTTIVKRLLQDKWTLVSSGLKNSRQFKTLDDSRNYTVKVGDKYAFGSYDDSRPVYDATADAGTTGKYEYVTDDHGNGPEWGSGIGWATKSDENTTITSDSKHDVVFQGDLHDDDVSVALANAGFHLVGNPYPTYLYGNNATADATNNVLTLNNAGLSEATLWFWDSANESWITKNQSSGAYHISPLQGFFVKSSSAGNFNFTEEMQTHTSNGDTFNRSENNRFEIDLSIANEEKTSSTSIRYINNKTKSFDNGYDSSLFDGYASALEVYTGLVAGNSGKKLAIQSLPNENYEDMVVPVGVTAAANSEIEFSAEALNIPSGYKVFLEDRANNTFTRLDEANAKYTATVTDASTEGRFFLHTSMQSALSVEDALLNSVSIYKSNATTLRVVGLSQGEASVKLFNVMGKQVMSSSFNAQGVKEIALPSLSTGVYIVQLETEAGTLNKKIILE